MILRVRPAAERELREAFDWYEAEREGLGLELIVEFDRIAARLVARPLETPLWREDRPYRKKVLRRFPYAVFFHLEGDVVVVDAFAHVRRRPGFWTER